MIDIRCSREGYECNGCPIKEKCDDDSNSSCVDLWDIYKQGRSDKYQEIVSEYMLLTEEQVAEIRAEAFKEVSRAMYHQCFECNNDENMQKWDSGNWFRYKLFENVIELLKEQKNGR